MLSFNFRHILCQWILSIIRGDSYPAEVVATVYAVMQKLNFSNLYRLTLQSQVEPKPWLGAQIEKTCKRISANESVPGVIIVPFALTSEHIETLHELDIELKDSIEYPEKVIRCESLNGDSLFLDVLANLVKEHLESGLLYLKQLPLDYKLDSVTAKNIFKHPDEYFHDRSQKKT